ncbi:RING/U-box superfamily protein [Striga hermonthica]|uniref:RING-type E3 ubiquitin transferase n=1 Tax=Striga hermonthica TaxID=68872 RepID=A0A9N7MPB0_STRHE|nr:RING/U-box superfamily protein [Striga hermonthica]
MGAVCGCLRDEWEDYVNPNSSINRNCICLQCFMQSLVHTYASLFHRGEEQALPSSSQGTTSLTSVQSTDNSIGDMYRSPPLPLPYDADQRYFRLAHDGMVGRRDKGSSHLNEETEPLRLEEPHEESEPMSAKGKWNDFSCDDYSKKYNSKLSVKGPRAEPTTGFAHINAASEDEDVCPTCLEEYTTENPKIITKCSHHFHLGCIYEWMERSDNCPVCGKVMAFDETT